MGYFSTLVVLLAAVAESTSRTQAVNEELSVGAYFGNGCFFHEQNVFVVEFEEKVLKRTGGMITTVAGYGGGAASDRLCYHNAGSVSDYGTLGHAEVVIVDVPASQMLEAARVFFGSFTEIIPGQWSRHDTFDLGEEYRAVIGVPGGVDSPHMVAMKQANMEFHQLTLLAGKGSDPDTFLNNTVYVYDSIAFPATQAEVCLQFQDESPTNSPPYTAQYHALQQIQIANGHVKNTTCPPNFIC